MYGIDKSFWYFGELPNIPQGYEETYQKKYLYDSDK